MTTVEALEGMRALMAEGWTRGTNFETPGNRKALQGGFIAARAAGREARCCAAGALLVVAGDRWPELHPLAAHALRRAMNMGDAMMGIHILNDRCRTQAEALAWVDRAIEIATEDGEAGGKAFVGDQASE